MWIRDPNCYEVVKRAWECNTSLNGKIPIGRRIVNMAKSLRRWNREFFGMCYKRIVEIEQNIKWYQSLNPTEENMKREKQLQEELSEWMARQEILWRQKSRELWLMAGDSNSKFFHAAAVTNRRRIFIATIKNNEGNWLESRDQIGEYLHDEFTNLFKEERTMQCQGLRDFIPTVISADQNERLSRIPDSKEIFEALRSINPTKALGPNGMFAVFFQHFWNIVGNDDTRTIQNIFRHDRFPHGLNDAHMVLIPKLTHFSTFNYIKPIAL